MTSQTIETENEYINSVQRIPREAFEYASRKVEEYLLTNWRDLYDVGMRLVYCNPTLFVNMSRNITDDDYYAVTAIATLAHDLNEFYNEKTFEWWEKRQNSLSRKLGRKICRAARWVAKALVNAYTTLRRRE